MNTVDILDNNQLFRFIKDLRSAGYHISTAELLTAQHLLIALAAHDKFPKKIVDFKTLLRPVLCHSPKEQDNFNRHFDHWVSQVEGEKPDNTPTNDFSQLSGWEKIKLWFQTHKNVTNGFVIVGLLIVLILLGIALVPKNPDDSGQPPKTPSQPVMPISAPTDVPNVTPTIPADSNPNRQEQDKNTQNNEEKPALYQQWQPWVLLFLLLSWLLLRLLRQLQLPTFLARKTAKTPKITKLFFEDVLKDVDSRLFQSLKLARVAQQLRKHTPIATDRLDIKATIRRTIRARGWFTPVTGSVMTMPEYLVLIDRTTFKDHHSHLIDTLVNRLTAQGVFVARYYFDGDPRHCYPENDELPPQLLTELADRYPAHRLLIFSEGKDFIDPLTGDIAFWIEQFSGWTHRTFFTLAEQAHWGYREKLLKQTNFLVMPATETGLTQLAERMYAETGQFARFHPTEAMTDSSAFPSAFNAFSEWWLERHPPEPSQVTDLLAQVRAFLTDERGLGDKGYYWFSACAIYPELHWQITLYLGEQLKLSGEKLLNEERLAKLARLPWFHYGYMPNWLREQLIKELSLPQEREIRTVLEKLLEQLQARSSQAASEKQSPSDLEAGFYLEVATPPNRMLSLLTWMKQAPKYSPLRDYVFQSFMSDPLAVKIPKILKGPMQYASIWQLLFGLVSMVMSWVKFFVRGLGAILSTIWQRLSNVVGLIVKIPKIVKVLVPNDFSWIRLLQSVFKIVLLLSVFTFFLIFLLNGNMYGGIGLSFFMIFLLGLLFVWKMLFKELSDLLFYCIPPLNPKWQSLPIFSRKLIANLAIGLSFTIFIIMGFHHNRGTLKQLDDISMDVVMESHSGRIPFIQEKKLPSFVLLDIDNDTQSVWGEPSFTLRNRLKNLIDAAIKAKSRLIVVLIRLNHPTPNEAQLQLHLHDKALSAYLVEYANQCKTGKAIVCPPIILARTLNDDNTVRTSFLEEAVAQAAPYVQWASTQAYMSDDGVIRRTSLWTPICIDGQPSVIASAELLTASIIRNSTPQQAQEILYNALAPLQPTHCKSVSMPPQFTENINIGELSIVPTNRKRILYNIFYDMDTPHSSPYIVRDNSGNPILTVLSAQSYAKSPPRVSLDFTDNIVVIGGSYDDYNIFNTPLGEMPGAFIFINSLYSLLQDKNLRPLSLWIWLILMSVVVVIMSILTLLSSFFYKFIMYTMIIIILGIFVFSSVTLFSYGIWVNFLLPFIVMGMMSIFEKLPNTFSSLLEAVKNA